MGDVICNDEGGDGHPFGVTDSDHREAVKLTVRRSMGDTGV